MANIPETSDRWFDYPIRVQPHHTDYGGVVWHGNYLTWMESARVECLRFLGVDFSSLVNLGYDLPVVGIDLRYKRPLTLGKEAVIKTRLAPLSGLRLIWDYRIETLAPSAQLCVTGAVTLVTVNVHDRKVVRNRPPEFEQMLNKVASHFATP